jgi:hypothetical protein
MWVYEHETSQYDCHKSADRQPCVGRRCMAWRWGYVNKIDDPNFKGDSFSAAEVGVREGKFPANSRFRARKGFCGIAGQPKE